MDAFQARAELIRRGFILELQSPYDVPVVLDSTYDEVKAVCKEIGYRGSFLVLGKCGKSRKKQDDGPRTDAIFAEEGDGQMMFF